METKTITVAVKVDVSSGREILSGILAFTDPSASWHYKIFQSLDEITDQAIQTAIAESTGFIMAIGAPRRFESLLRAHKPVVYISQSPAPERKGFAAMVRNDNHAIGRTGGEHLAELCAFASYAFVHAQSGQSYSLPREKGFRAALRMRSIRTCQSFLSPHDEGSDEDITALADWLVLLPKPAAVMAGCDRRAIHVLSAAQRAHIRVPEQLAIIGVDNDELQVEHSSPPLSSVQPGHFEMGFTAAKELCRLMSTRSRTSVRITNVPPKRVVVRESTRHLPPAVALVERAKKFIAERAASGIGVEDVVAHLGCSRNLADLRYKAAEGLTIHAAIEATRLEAVKRLLKTTQRPVTAIAAQCGYKSANRLTHLFKQRFGMTIRDWRLTTAAEDASARGRGKGGRDSRDR